MGVHALWSIIEPARESVPLFALSGQTLAVDLSLWVCEAQHVQAMMGRVAKPHLRNLFFRVSSLTRMGVKLVFVMEGDAPRLKAETMKKRTAARYGGCAKGPAPTGTSRGRFKAVLRECADMLDCLGVPWVTAAGEAEALCAYLDAHGLVDGCITDDGDAFLYGARTVYRNLNLSSKDPQVDCYRMSRVQTELHLCRDDLVGLAILLGCDYIPKGVPGVGREQALKLVQMLNGQTLLQRFSQWGAELRGVSEGAVQKVAHCQLCRHPGSAKAHERGGCFLCDSERSCQPRDFDSRCPCDWHRLRHARQASAYEANIRKKTLATRQFPFTEIIGEFLVFKDKPVSHFRRRRPDMLSMQSFAFERMAWPEHYTSEKVLVLMTYTQLMDRGHGRGTSSQIRPLRILKPRVRNAVACFEVVWSAPEHFVFPDDLPAEEQQEVRTVEEESLFRLAYPEVVERYLQDKRSETLGGAGLRRKPKRNQETPSGPDSGGISDLLARMSLAGPEPLLRPVSDPGDPSGCPDTTLSRTAPEASPSVSPMMEALHLSDVDWDASSFTSSPNQSKETEDKTEGHPCVRAAVSSPAVRRSDPAQSRPRPPRPMRSVCQGGGSSSEDSGAEDQQFGPQRKPKIRTRNKNRSSSPSRSPPRPETTRRARSTRTHGDVSAAAGWDGPFLQTPASPVSSSDGDGDGSASCSESPLPLAERLRLKTLRAAE
ncbi:flap endonuclease GEN homolog 1 [Brachionichthys hirsutus]|uniref:flap endonuclease GEN homolog 1 n=1 Tax=Brachionichthys hirsutus TaxID=412623 RepID=UPI0036044A24